MSPSETNSPTQPAPRFYQQAWPEEFRFFQLGFLVDNILASAKAWHELYGIGPFHIIKSPQKVSYRGQETELQMRLAVAQAGPVQIELLCQGNDAPSVYREIYGSGEGGFHHMCSLVTDYDAALAHYRACGCEVAAEVHSESLRVGYVDTTAAVGMMTEVVQGTDAFRQQLQRISDTCATWDGTDPLRVLTRDGYVVPEGY